MNLHVIRRIATLEEVSAVACFLAGPSGGYMTGGVIDVAGGLESNLDTNTQEEMR